MDVDLISGAAAAAAAWRAKDLPAKVLGPTADYVGGQLKGLVEKCNVNLDGIFQAAFRRGAAEQRGSVNPRVAQTVIADGAFCDATIFKEYYGGLLCASKGEGQSDAAAPYLAILKGMSTLQLRMHFLCYSLVHTGTYPGVPNLLLEEVRNGILLVSPFKKLFKFLERDESEHEAVLSHLISGLQRMSLIGPYYQFGPPEYLSNGCRLSNGQSRRLF